MKFNLQLIARMAIPVCLVLATTSVYYAKQLGTTNAGLESQVTKQLKDLSSLQEDGKQLESVLVKDKSKIILDETLSAVLLGMSKHKIDHGVTISVLVVEKKGGSGATPLAQLSEKVKGTDLKTIKLIMKGGYQTYEGLQAYLNQLKQEYPLAIVALKVDNKSFELGIRLYGN